LPGLRDLALPTLVLAIFVGCTPATTPSAAPSASGPNLAAAMTDPTLAVSTFASGLDQPTGIAFLGDGDALVTEKATGRVMRVHDGTLGDPVIDLAVNNFDERGLLGIALHPDFETTNFVYLYWTQRVSGAAAQSAAPGASLGATPEDPADLLGDDSDQATEVPNLGNRVDRFTWDGSALTFDRNIVRLRSNTLDKDTSGRIRGNHDAGPIAFGPDDKLYVTLGDQNLRGQLQNIADGPPPDDATFTGVILRLDDDGTAPSDNPFYAQGTQMGGAAGANVQKIYAYGVRNTFGLTFDPKSGNLWETENGDDAYDEVNVFKPGANSGWIQLMGPPDRFDEWKKLETESKDGFDNPGFPPDKLAANADEAQARLFKLDGSAYSAPVLSYRYPPALTSVWLVRDDALGETSRDTAWFGTVLTDSILRYPLAADGAGLALEGGLADKVDDNIAKGDLGESKDNVVGTGFGIITDIRQGPDGLLYVVSLSDGIVYRIGQNEGGAGPSASAPATVPAGSPAPGSAPPASGPPASGATELTIGTTTDASLKFDPATATVPTGVLVRLTFENRDTVPHNLTFGEPINAKTATVVPPAASETIEFTAPTPGSYKFNCTLHPGMEGTLQVTP
jgi:glucose/arabinose dehydrogenase/plastocyanin